jgi:hypothetical protein
VRFCEQIVLIVGRPAEDGMVEEKNEIMERSAVRKK